MGSVYKRRKRDGKLHRNYSIIYFDHTGKRVTKSAGTSDKRAAERILAAKEAEVALISSGVEDPLQERFVMEGSRPITSTCRTTWIGARTSRSPWR